MRARIILLALFAAIPHAANAGAWTEPKGHAQIIVETTWSNANASFDSSGAASQPVGFEKLLSSIDAEYGWNDWLTLIVAPEYAHARTERLGGTIDTANDFAARVGARVRLDNSFGVLSAEFSAKSAGAFAMSVSRGNAPGRQLEMRLLYGTNFKLFHYKGYADVEAGYTWIAGPRADEFPIDFSLGLQLDRRNGILLQSFNIITANNARPPYGYYRLHKLQASTVTRLSRGVSFVSGAFISPAGQNSLVERGVTLALWVNF